MRPRLLQIGYDATLADLGDGWDATYTVASLLAQEQLKVGGIELQRGSFLIMGGDEVYPLASRDNYHERTVSPYTCALPRNETDPPSVFAIPGNHDWYDGLISFVRLFCQPRWIGGWQTRQRRSYFAIRLPHNWWLWALDYQLASDIDEPQRDYFTQVADQMPPGAKVILAGAEPDWIYGNIYDTKYQTNIAYLQKNIIEERAHATMQVAIAGDLHHYRRHESVDGSKVQLITSGGGGAFLLGTCGPNADRLTLGKKPAVKTYSVQAEYPDRKRSLRMLLRNLLFPFINPKFGVVPGIMYLAIAWIYRVPLQHEYEVLLQRGDPARGATAILHAILSSPFGFGILLLVVVGFVAFTDTHAKPYKYIAGTAHALANLAALFWISAAASQISRVVFGFGDNSVAYLLSTAGLIFAGGYLAGAVIMGVYLLISQLVFRRHSEEAFSALRIPDCRNFVRFHIDASGRLTIYPIGVDHVPRKWRESQSQDGPRWAPVDRAIQPRFIEPPIVISERPGPAA